VGVDQRPAGRDDQAGPQNHPDRIGRDRGQGVNDLLPLLRPDRPPAAHRPALQLHVPYTAVPPRRGSAPRTPVITRPLGSRQPRPVARSPGWWEGLHVSSTTGAAVGFVPSRSAYRKYEPAGSGRSTVNVPSALPTTNPPAARPW